MKGFWVEPRSGARNGRRFRAAGRSMACVRPRPATSLEENVLRRPSNLRKVLLGVSVSSAFVIGCVAGAARSTVPKAEAAYVIEQRWEYFCFAEERAERVQEKANAAGARGWEMVAAAPGEDGKPVWCFRLPRP